MHPSRRALRGSSSNTTRRRSGEQLQRCGIGALAFGTYSVSARNAECGEGERGVPIPSRDGAEPSPDKDHVVFWYLTHSSRHCVGRYLVGVDEMTLCPFSPRLNARLALCIKYHTGITTHDLSPPDTNDFPGPTTTQMASGIAPSQTHMLH